MCIGSKCHETSLALFGSVNLSFFSRKSLSKPTAHSQRGTVDPRLSGQSSRKTMPDISEKSG